MPPDGMRHLQTASKFFGSRTGKERELEALRKSHVDSVIRKWLSFSGPQWPLL